LVLFAPDEQHVAVARTFRCVAIGADIEAGRRSVAKLSY